MSSTGTPIEGKQSWFLGTGRRKESVARVFLRPGTGKFTVNGRQVASREEFYRTLWQLPMDQDVRVTVRRPGGIEAITVRPMDRYRFYRTSDN